MQKIPGFFVSFARLYGWRQVILWRGIFDAVSIGSRAEKSNEEEGGTIKEKRSHGDGLGDRGGPKRNVDHTTKSPLGYTEPRL